MKTLELKDICGYLPYGLNYLRPDGSTILQAHGTLGTLLQSQENGQITYSSLSGCRPILRPMSDLTKEITHEGERFVPTLALDKLNCFPVSDTEKALRYYDKLNEWMFDYRNLIYAGLAIDVNTLPENPYE